MGQLKPKTRKAPRLASNKPVNQKLKRTSKPRTSVKSEAGRPQAETAFDSVFGDYVLRRYPVEKRETLRAWDAADEYCLQYIKEQNLLFTEETAQAAPASHHSVMIFNDAFGGLSLPLHSFNPVVVTDSYISQQGIKQNLAANSLELSMLRLCNSLDDIESCPSGPVDIVLYKLPKNNALLEYQLYQLRSIIDAHTTVIAAGMTRHIHSSTLELFEKIIGPTHTTLAKKKSRLIISQYDPDMAVQDCPYPLTYTFPLSGNAIEEATEVALINHAAIFSGAKPDIGTRFFLQHLVVPDAVENIVDLGCGNGIVGIAAALMNHHARVIFTDESYMAVESARLNFIECFDDTRDAEFLQTDCLVGIDNNSVDMILCNPPFHQDHVVTDSIAWRMFHQSFDKLRDGGELWVIGNRHLGYHAKLKRIFGKVEVVASNAKFSVMKTVRTRKNN